MTQQVGMPNDHIDEDLLEEYALGRLTDEAVIAPIEEHLLICEECRMKLIDAEGHGETMRSALEELQADPRHPAERDSDPHD
jgi:predicted  nucleic acid-binding Zn-ribbon protein